MKNRNDSPVQLLLLMSTPESDSAYADTALEVRRMRKNDAARAVQEQQMQAALMQILFPPEENFT